MTSGPEKLLERMRASKHGWSFDDLDQLYRGFGFSHREGGKHRVYWHPTHKGLMATVTRHHKLPVGYTQTAIRLIDKLLELRQGGEPQS